MDQQEIDKKFLTKAINLSLKPLELNTGGPFGCIITKDNSIVAIGWNKVTSTNDPTAHAEVVAIRNACKELKNFKLDDCVLYTSCEPCPMCLSAIYWAGIKRVVFSCTKNDAASIGFSDKYIYNEIKLPYIDRSVEMKCMLRDQGYEKMKLWLDKKDKMLY